MKPLAPPKMRPVGSGIRCECSERRSVRMPWQTCSECGEFVPMGGLPETRTERDEERVVRAERPRARRPVGPKVRYDD